MCQSFSVEVKFRIQVQNNVEPSVLRSTLVEIVVKISDFQVEIVQFKVKKITKISVHKCRKKND